MLKHLYNLNIYIYILPLQSLRAVGLQARSVGVMGLQSWVLRALCFEASGLIGLAGWV